MIALWISLALAADLPSTGAPADDRIFKEIGGYGQVLDAAVERMSSVQSEVAGPLGLPPKSSIELSVWTLKERAGPGLRLMEVEGRPLLALGPASPPETKAAASALNEATQEVLTMAADLELYPPHIQGLLGNVSSRSDVATSNLRAGEAIGKRAASVAAAARAMLDEVRTGLAATTRPQPPKVAPVKKPPEKLTDVVARAREAYGAKDHASAQELLDRADLLLPRQVVPVARQELLELFQLRAAVKIELGDASSAAWSTMQVHVIHPSGSTSSSYGNAFAQLHKAMGKAGIVQSVEVVTTGSGRAYLSGNELGTGSSVMLGKGQHLLQVQDGEGWRSSVVYVDDGFVVKLD